jgi:hypothetical protein
LILSVAETAETGDCQKFRVNTPLVFSLRMRGSMEKGWGTNTSTVILIINIT